MSVRSGNSARLLTLNRIARGSRYIVLRVDQVKREIAKEFVKIKQKKVYVFKKFKLQSEELLLAIAL